VVTLLRPASTLLAAAAIASAGALVVVPAASAAPVSVTDWAGLQTAVSAGGEVALDADITQTSGSYLVVPATSVTLDLHGHSLSISGVASYHAAVEVHRSATLVITDSVTDAIDNRLTAVGGADGAGIGSQDNWTNGNVTIGGTAVVVATGGNRGAGIGGSYAGDGGTITIGGSSNVTATGGGSAAGIGGGWGMPLNGNVFGGKGGTISIEGNSTVTAVGGASAAGIGGGVNGAGAVLEVGPDASVTVSSPRAFGSGSGLAAPWGSLSNAGRITLPTGSILTVPTGVTVANAGSIANQGSLDGTGTIVNSGRIVGAGAVAGDGQGAAGVTIQQNSFLLSFDANGGEATAPTAMRVLAATVDDAGAALPAVTVAAGPAFTGWYAAPAGGARITDTTDLVAAFGAGPASATLYAHYQAAQEITFDPATPTTGTVGASATLSATGGGSNEPVTFSVDPATTAGACTIGGDTVSFVAAGTCVIAADQAGSAEYTAAPTVTRTIEVAAAPVARRNPTITATVSGPAGSNGWYVGKVRVTFTCTAGTAPLSQACPAPVTLGRGGADRVLARSIAAADGGSAAVDVRVSIDPRKAVVSLRRTRSGHVRCVASDRFSGLTPSGCSVTRKVVRRAHRVVRIRYTATAVDIAGNRTVETLVVRRRR